MLAMYKRLNQKAEILDQESERCLIAEIDKYISLRQKYLNIRKIMEQMEYKIDIVILYTDQSTFAMYEKDFFDLNREEILETYAKEKNTTIHFFYGTLREYKNYAQFIKLNY